VAASRLAAGPGHPPAVLPGDSRDQGAAQTLGEFSRLGCILTPLFISCAQLCAPFVTFLHATSYPSPLDPFLKQIDALLVANRAISQEALRTVAICSLGGWTADRLVEAGVDDLVTLPSWLVTNRGGDQLVTTAGQVPVQLVGWSAAASLVGLALVTLAAVVAAEAQELAAASLLLETRVGREVREQAKRRQQQRKAGKGGTDRASSGSGWAGGGSCGAEAEAEPAGPKSATEAALDALLAPAAGSAAARAAAAAAEGGDDSEEDEEEEVDPLVLEWRLQLASEVCTGSTPARLAGYLAFARGLLRLAAANAAVVVAGGNFGAVVAGALVLDGVQLLCASVNGGRREPGDSI
jgi:hypothetical protein